MAPTVKGVTDVSRLRLSVKNTPVSGLGAWQIRMAPACRACRAVMAEEVRRFGEGRADEAWLCRKGQRSARDVQPAWKFFSLTDES
jgi:hypothetical protein